MNRSLTCIALTAAFFTSDIAHAFLGSAPVGTAQADYSPITGEMSVSVNGVNNWYIESSSSSLNGSVPFNLPAGGGVLWNTDSNVGETSLSAFSYTDVYLGPVAATGLAVSSDNTIPDLDIFWTTGLNQPLQVQPVIFTNDTGDFSNLPPIADINGPFDINLFSDPLDITLDASGSSDDGNLSPLIYSWDLDNDNTFEIDTGTISTLDIPDVDSTFGGVGNHTVAVQVFDGEFTGTAFTSVRIVDEPFPTAELSAIYDPMTGQIIVSVDGVINWYIESASSGLTGDPPLGLPAGGGLVSDADYIVGETTGFVEMSYTNVNLGNVAQPGLPLGDLTLYWNETLGTPSWSQPVTYGTIIPEPSTLSLFGACLTWSISYRRKRLMSRVP